MGRLMGALMELVAGDATAILVAISTDDLPGLSDSTRFTAHLSLGAGLDPTWLDLFSEAVRTIDRLGRADRLPRRPARAGRPGRGRRAGRSSASTAAGSRRSPGCADREVPAVAGRWLDLLDEELGQLPREEKPWIRELAGQVVGVLPDRGAGSRRPLRLVALNE